MRILQLSKYYPPTFGGVELVAEFFARASTELGEAMDVVALGADTRTYTGRHGERVWQCREDVKLASSPFSLEYLRRVRRALVEAPPAVILVHLPHPFAHEVVKLLRPQIRAAGARVVGIYHSDIVNQRLLRDLYELHFLRDADAYDAWVCSSPNLRDSSPVLSRFSRLAVHVIPFCVHPPPPDAGVGGEEADFIAIGRMVPYKGYEFLLEAVRGTSYRLTLVGDGPLLPRLRALAPPNVRFTGPVDDEEKYRLMRLHRALVMSSVNRAEAYGMTIVEAFSVGLPVVAADIDTGVSFLVREEQTGLKFPVRDVAGLRRSLERIKDDAALREQLARGASAFYESELTFPAFARRTSALLRALAET